jgi:uncharacterized membrane protein YdjX (TVP38/TMEM64 family)
MAYGAFVGRRSPLRRFAPVVLIAAGLLAAHWLHAGDYLSLDYLQQRRTELRLFVHEHFWMAAFAYLAFYTLAIALLFPAASILTVAGGFLFDWWLGGPLAVLGASAGASCLFLAARSAFGDLLRARADGAVARFADGFRRDAFTYMLVLRLTPVFPFSAVSIAAALLGVGFRPFAAATFLGIVPGAMVYAFLGDGLDATLKLAAADGHVSLADLVTAKTVAALAGLSALAVLGAVLKRRFLGRGTAS